MPRVINAADLGSERDPYATPIFDTDSDTAATPHTSCRRCKIMMGIIAVLVIGIVVGIVIWWMRRKQTPSLTVQPQIPSSNTLNNPFIQTNPSLYSANAPINASINTPAATNPNFFSTIDFPPTAAP